MPFAFHLSPQPAHLEYYGAPGFRMRDRLIFTASSIEKPSPPDTRTSAIQEEGTVAQETTFDTAQIMIDFTQMKAFGPDPLILAEDNGVRVTHVFGKARIDGLSGVFALTFPQRGEGLVEV